MREVYTHSGKVGHAPWIVPLVGALVALASGYPYAYATRHAPLHALQFAALLAFVFVVFLGVGVAGKLANARSLAVMVALGALAGLLALYAAWAGHLSLDLSEGGPERGYFALLCDPLGLRDALLALHAKPPSSPGRPTLIGGELWALWGAEALVIVGAGVAGGIATLSGDVFCEPCGEWAEEVKPAPRLVIPKDASVLADLRAGSCAALAELAPRGEGLGTYLEVTIQQCPHCRATATYQVHWVERRVGRREAEELTTKAWTPQLICDAAQVEAFRRLAAREALAQAAPDHEAAHGGDAHAQA